jgi:hypothetical protein
MKRYHPNLTEWRRRGCVALAGLMLTSGCAGRVAPVTPYDVAKQQCEDQAYEQTSGLRTATYITTALGLIVWPALVVPAVLGGVAVGKERAAREECMQAKGLAPAPGSAPAAAVTQAPAPPAPAPAPVMAPASVSAEPHL